MSIELEILRASHKENWKFAKEITEILGVDHPKAKNQWKETDNILHNKKTLENVQKNRICDDKS